MNINSSMSGFRPQLLPMALLHSHRVAINLLHLFSKGSFQVSFLSRTTIRYLACLENSSRCLFSFSVLLILHLYRLVKITTSIFPGFTKSHVVRHQVSMTFNVCCITPIIASKCVPCTTTRISSAYPMGWHPWSMNRCNSSPTLDSTAGDIVLLPAGSPSQRSLEGW